MAEQPRFFTVAPWGHRVLTPWLASSIPVRNIARAFRIVTFTALLAAGGVLFLYLRALGHGMPAAVLGAGLFTLLPPVAECLRYVFLAEPVAVLLEVALLLALQSGAGLGPLCLIAVLGTLAKEFFVLLVPVALVVGPRPMLPRAWKAAVLFAVALGAAFALRWWWTPHLPAPLPAASPATLLLALHRFHDSFPEWWRSTLLAGVAPLAVLGAWRGAAAPVRSVAVYVVALAVIPPFLNPVTFFPSDVPRLLIYTLPVAIPLAVCAAMAPASRAPRPDWPRRRGVGIAATLLAVAAAVAPLAIVDRYRRADLTGPRDGPYVLVVCRETLRTARRLSRGEEVALDPSERRFAWGDSHPSEMDRMRWFLREGWGERAHYGTGEVTMHAAQASVLLPVLTPADLSATLQVQAPRPLVVDASINGRPLRSWAVGPDTAPETVAIPGAALFRGDNLLTLSARDGAPGARLRKIVYRGAPEAASDPAHLPDRAPRGAGVSSVVRSLKAFAAVILAVTATPLAVAQFSRDVPTVIPSVQGWERITGDLEFQRPRVAVQYEFYINPARPASYEVVRYRVTDLGPVPKGRTRYPTTEKLQWDRDGRDVRRFECVVNVAGGAGCAWQEMEKGGADYLREVPVLLWLYGAHHKMMQDRAAR